jgi:copper resistance protein B
MNIMKPALTIISSCAPLAFALAVGVTPAVAQEMDHSKMQMPAPKPADAKRAEASKPLPKRPAADPHADHAPPPPAPEPAPEPSPAPAQAVDHAAMGHDKPEAETRPEDVDHAAMGHDMAMPDDPMPGMDHSAMTGDLPADAAPREPIPPVTPADRAAAFPDVQGHTVHDNAIHSYWLLDRLEAWDADPGTGVGWEAVAWIGTDLDRIWLRSEGERIDGSTESADIEVLYGRAVARWWDMVVGVRHDFGEGPSQTFAAIGIQGLAPYWFEVEATAYLGQSGQTAARLEVEYDTLLTNRLILQWLAEAEFHGKDDPSRGIGSGLGTVEAGLRLRYEFTRRFAPYVGVVRERAFGGTADLRRGAGEDIDDTRLVAGVRIWF